MINRNCELIPKIVHFDKNNSYSKNNENVTCLRIIRKKIVTYENLRKTYENKILIF
jgi:hypothetical protein